MAAKKMPIRAALKKYKQDTATATRAALEEYAVRLVSDAQQRAPVRKVFHAQVGGRKKSKATTGKLSYLNVGQTGRGARILVNRYKGGPQIRATPGGGELVLGRVVHRSGRRAADPGTFKSNLASRHLTQVGRAAARSGRGSRPIYAQGYQLNSTYSPLLTSRARYDLARGIGVHEVGAGSASRAGGGAVILGGALRDSIHATDIVDDGNGFQFELTASVRYAKYVEYGTYKDYAQPFLRPALKESKKYLRQIMRKHLKHAGLTVKG
jgi:HK97 gp10 family phage protein